MSRLRIIDANYGNVSNPSPPPSKKIKLQLSEAVTVPVPADAGDGLVDLLLEAGRRDNPPLRISCGHQVPVLHAHL